MLDGQSVDLLAFGEEFANQLDPLHPAERSQGYFSRQDPYATGQTYETDDAKLRRFLARWLGGDWRQGDKLGREAARPPTVSPGAMLFNDGD